MTDGRRAEVERSAARTVAEAGVTLIETTAPAGSHQQLPALARPHFTLVLAGRLRIAGDEPSRPCEPPAVLFTPAGAGRPSAFEGEGGRRFDVRLDRPVVPDGGALDRRVCHHDGGPSVWVLARLYQEFLLGAELSPIIVNGLVLHLIGSTMRAGRREPENRGWLDAVREALHDGFPDPLPMKTIAAAVGVHPVSLARGFRRRFGVSPGSYARQLRVEHASRALVATAQSVREVASRAGFANPSHLTRAFKLETGMTPHAYRRLFGRATPGTGPRPHDDRFGVERPS
jgi:AraC family transcriptional regulator